MKKVGIVLGILVIGLIAFIATRPTHYRVERSLTMAAPADVVFEHVNVLKAWSAWSPWEKLDPTMEKTYSGPDRGVGAAYEWKSQKVGQGKMTILESTPNKQVALELHFIAPFDNTARAELALAPGAEGTSVTWSMDGDNDFMGKAFGMFMNMDTMLGKDFEGGLAELKTVTEAATKQRAQEQAAAQAAAAQAAAQAAAAQAAAAPAAEAKPEPAAH